MASPVWSWVREARWGRRGRPTAGASPQWGVDSSRSGKPTAPPLVSLEGRSGGNILWDHDGTRLAVASDNAATGLVSLFADGRPGPVLRPPWNNNTISAVAGSAAWSPDGKWIAVYGYEGDESRIALLHADGRLARTFPEHQGQVTALAWSPDSQRLAVAHMGLGARVWNVDGTPSAVHQAGTNVLSIAWDPTGEWLATGGDDGKIRHWQANGTAGPVLEGHTGLVRGVSWNPKGKTLASAGDDGTIRLWEPAGRCKTLFTTPGALLAVAWEPGTGSGWPVAI